ncbi:MAG: M64 family metallopeptidase [Candidatus Zixiibacteriota bacterium]
MRIAKISLCLMLILVGSALASSQGQMWQLTLTYDQTGLQIVEAAPIPPSPKEIRTPGIESAPIRIAYNIDWLDQSGNALQSTSAEMPVGFLTAPGEDGTPCQRIVPDDGAMVLRLAGPAPATAPSAIRFARASVAQRAAIGLPVPAGLDFTTSVVPIQRINQNSARRDGPLSSVKLRDTGPDNNRLVFVALGDGYTQANLNAGAFTTAANNFVNAFNNKSPWNILFKGTNVYRIDVASNEQGTDNDPQGTFKDTYFNSSFWVNNIQRLLAVDGTGYVRAVDAANAFVGPGLWDNIFILVNSTTYGGSGGGVSVISVHSSAAEVALHETGHTFARLADEYSDPYPGFPAGDGEPNVDYDFSGPGLKWLIWVEGGMPLPTPNNGSLYPAVGAYEGARYLTTGIYRPCYTCEMKALNQFFCPVCIEAHIHTYTTSVNLTDSIGPDSGMTVLLPFAGAQFALKPIPIGQMTYEWKLGTTVLPQFTDSAVTLDTKQLYALGAPYTRTLTATMSFPTTLMRKYSASKSITWTVKPDCNGNGIADDLDISSHTSADANHNGIPDECDAAICCIGTRGNVDGSGIVDLSDLSVLVIYLTGGGYTLPCVNEANLDGAGTVDLSDLSALVSFLTGGGYVFPPCP